MAELILPEKIRRLIGGEVGEDISGRSCAQTFLTKAGILKIGETGSLAKQAAMTEFLFRRGLSAEVLAYETAGAHDYLLMRRLRGQDGTARQYLDEPRKLCRVLAEALRTLHEADMTGCPVTDCNERALSLLCNRGTASPDNSYFGALGVPMPDADWIRGSVHLLRRDTLIHGDACLPNIMMDNFTFTGFIDVGEGGIGDRHFDLFWAIWSLSYNLGTDAFREPFLDAYGRDAVDTERLRICALLSSL